MSSDAVIEVDGVSKSYLLYKTPQDRLKQMFEAKKREFEEKEGK